METVLWSRYRRPGRGGQHIQLADTLNLVPCGASGSDAVGEPAPSVPSLYRHDVRDAGHEGLGRSCPQQETSVNALSGALFLVLQFVLLSGPRATQRQTSPFLTTKKWCVSSYTFYDIISHNSRVSSVGSHVQFTCMRTRAPDSYWAVSPAAIWWSGVRAPHSVVNLLYVQEHSFCLNLVASTMTSSSYAAPPFAGRCTIMLFYEFCPTETGTPQARN